jgi:predicted MFS family arabinose efflux permease
MEQRRMNTREASAAFLAPLAVLACGHMLSNMLRTLPALAADVLARDLAVSHEGLASLTGAFHFAFAAGQIPLGVALDRFGVKPVALALVGTIAVGAVLAAMAGGPGGFLLAQIVMGLGCSGMLLCPMTLAAKLLSPGKFGLWTGLIQALGNVGMLLSASPLAWVVEHLGWRTGFWVPAGLAVVVIGLIWLVVPAPAAAEAPRGPRPSLLADSREVLRLGASARLRGVMLLSFSSFALIIGVRGLWGGPWLMEVKHLSRIEAGNVLLLATLALIAGPTLAGVLDRRFGQRRAMLALGHGIAGLLLLAVAAGGPGGALSRALGLPMLPGAADAALLFACFMAISSQALIFAMTRAVVAPDQVGKAMSAVNLSFFAGAAVLQAASGPVGAAGGVGVALAFFAGAVLLGTALFVATTRKQA